MSPGSVRTVKMTVLLAMVAAVTVTAMLMIFAKGVSADTQGALATPPAPKASDRVEGTSCTLYANDPHFSSHQSGRVNSGGKVQCGDRIHKIFLGVGLQIKKSTGWEDFASNTTTKRDATYARAFANRGCPDNNRRQYRTRSYANIEFRNG